MFLMENTITIIRTTDADKATSWKYFLEYFVDIDNKGVTA
jgi:hypothetical protein